jgi:hypothetical protein
MTYSTTWVLWGLAMSHEETSPEKPDKDRATADGQETPDEGEQERKDSWNKFGWNPHKGPEMRVDFVLEEEQQVSGDLDTGNDE